MLTRVELDSLLKTRNLLAMVVHVPRAYEVAEPVNAPLFNMNYAAKNYTCGTVMCIGGWMRVFQQGLNPAELTYDQRAEITEYVREGGERGNLKDLFYPFDASDNFSSITPAQAIKAIDNFIEFGEPKWREVCNASG